MSIERILSLKNIKQFDRIISFYKDIIIKDISEASLYETPENIKQYNLYKYAMEKSDTFFDYLISEDDLGSYYSFDEYISIGKQNLQELYFRGDTQAVAFMNHLREKRINSYVEQNEYYRMFLGLPRNQSEYIYVTNEDSGPDKIPIHIVNEQDYPNTYIRLFVKRNIDLIILEYPELIYLKFIENPYDVIYIHEAPQYTILYYPKGILTGQEEFAFFESYEAVRIKMLSVDYIEGYNDVYPEYNNLMFFLLLYNSFIHFINYYLKEFSLRNYSDLEIYEILDSNGLSKLKDMPISMLRKIVEYLPELMALKGSDEVINKIIDILEIKEISIKRYYLQKKYPTNSYGEIDIDYNKPYDSNVDIEFVEKVIYGNKHSTSNHIPYHIFVADDDLWGGVKDIYDTQSKFEIRERIRKEILQMDFSSILTKYMNVSKTVDIIEKTNRINDIMGIILQINEFQNFLYTDKLFYKSYELNPIAIWAALCYANASINGIPSPDIIRTDAYTIGDTLYLRNTMGIAQFVESVKNTEVEIGDYISTKKIGDILKNVNIIDYIVSFGYSVDTPVSEIIKQYDNNYKIYYSILEKIAQSSTVAEYNAWDYLRRINVISKRIDSLFNGNMFYTKFIESINSEFSLIVKDIMEQENNTTTYEQKLNLIKDLSNIFNEYISTKLNENIAIAGFDNVSSSDMQLMNNLILLLSEFTSIYTELYKVEFYQKFTDVPYNTLKLSYSKIYELFKQNIQEIMSIDSVKNKSLFKNKKNEEITIDEIIRIVHKISLMNSFFNDNDIIYKLVYTKHTIKPNELFEYNNVIASSIISNNSSDAIMLEDSIYEL